MLTCIIPFHNEKNRIHRVLDTITKVRGIDEIICINDASNDGSEIDISHTYPNVKLLHSLSHMGKSHTVMIGLKKALSNYIFLIDADLKQLRREELSRAIDYIQNNASLDMLILPDLNPRIETRLSRHDILFTGKRILTRNDLLHVFSECSPKKYQLEVATNQYMIDHKKHVEYFRISSQDTLKSEKIGMIRGRLKNFTMFVSIIFYKGICCYIFQVLFFGHKKTRL